MTTELPGGQKRRKDTILDEATRLFAERGYAACSMADLAECVGLRKASLFHHFPSKDDLYGAVLERLMRSLSDIISTSLSPNDPFEVQLDRMSDGMVAAFGEQPFAARIVAREMMDWGPFVRARFADLVTPIMQASETFLKSGMDAGAFRKRDPQQLLLTLIGIHVLPFAIGDLVKASMQKDSSSADFIRERREAVREQVRTLVLSKPN